LIDILLKRFDDSESTVSTLATLSWLMANLTRKPFPSFDKVKGLLPLGKFLLDTLQDKKALNSILFTLAYITEGSDEGIEQVIG